MTPGEPIAETEVERLTHGICDALKFLPPPSESAGTAILRGLLKGTPHEGHCDDNWSTWRPRD
jgi:hypothetical protein